MTDTDRMIDETVATGRRNREIIELARRHCLHMEFTEWAGGGRGMVEASTGLPIGMRRVRCPYESNPGGASGNLEWIASDFYVENCIGCEHRRPTGELPNLGSLVEERLRQEQEAADAEQLELRRQRDAWEVRAETRRVLRASADPAMASALDDIGIIDHDPRAASDADTHAAALRRLVALAAQAPQAFTDSVISHAFDVADREAVTSLLRPVRELRSHRPELGDRMLRTALARLRRGPDTDAADCLVDVEDLCNRAQFDGDVVRSLVALAGQRETSFLGRKAGRSPQPAALRIAATMSGKVVLNVLRDMLRPVPRQTTLVVPAGTRSSVQRDGPTDLERCTAAGAIRALAVTHPDVAGSLSGALILSLRDEDEDRHGLHATAVLQRTVAVLIVRSMVGIDPLHEAATHASDEYRERLFGVLTRVRWIVDPNDRFPEPGDPAVDDSARPHLHDMLVRECLARLSGDWGHEVAFHAGNLLEDLARDDPGRLSRHLPALLGVFLNLVDRVGRRPIRRIETVETTSPQLAALQEFSRRQAVHAAAHRVLRAVELSSAADVTGTTAAVRAVLQDDRDHDRDVDVRWRLLPLLGRIAQRHGDDPTVLRDVLPVLHTYLVDAEPALRAAALDAWVDIGSRHDVPSSLHDLLPALVQDQYKVVTRALLGAASRLDWVSGDERLLLRYAMAVADWAASAPDEDILKAALLTIRRLGRTQDARVAEALDLIVVAHAASLDGYDLRDVLGGSWRDVAAKSVPMAMLRLRLARDPAINDRFNARDYDEELTALLDCGAGLAELPVEDLTAAALELAPDYPFAAAEFMEVAWRAGRPADAEALMASVVDRTPDQPAFQGERAIAQCFRTTAAVDVAAATRNGVEAATDAAWDALQRLSDFADADEHLVGRLVWQVSIRLAARAALAGWKSEALERLGAPSTGASLEPAPARRQRADQLAHVARLLAENAHEQTATGAYLRAYAAALRVAEQFLRYDAAELDGDADGRESHLLAATRRARDAGDQLSERLGADDPLAGPLLRALDTVGEIRSGDDVESFLARLLTLSIPLLQVRGPRRRGRHHHFEPPPAPAPTPAIPVGVVLASIDEQVVTGPQVLRPNTVHRLQLTVAVDEWPEWATALDAEFVSHLTVDEAEMPTFTWARPVDTEETLYGEGTVVLRFGLPAGQPAPPFLLVLRFRGRRDGEPLTARCDVTGHREIRLRPFDASRDALTQYPVVDERLLELYEQLHSAGYNDEHVQPFCRLLTAVCRAGFTMTWEKRYKKGARVRERDFHDDLFDRLNADPELGGRVERGSPSALGFLDVRHDGVTAELKVERATAVTKETAPKYVGQPTQYASADGARLSILCVLDMSPKESPVGTPENYIFQMRPALHGLTNPEAPSIVTVVIVNANLPPPSSWSRRKVDVHTDETRRRESPGTPSGDHLPQPSEA